MKQVFRSRVSVLLLLFIAALSSLHLTYRPQGIYVALTIMVFFTLLFFLCARYYIAENILTIKCFYVSSVLIDLHEIYLVKRSYNPLAGPTASLKRLELWMHKLNGKPKLVTIISPVREQAFLEALKAINPDVLIEVSDKKGWWRIQDWDI